MITRGVGAKRSVLCVPAGDPYKLGKALASDADEVVIDLEDAVSVDEKDSAREALAAFDWSAFGQVPVLAVRINALDSRWWHQDLAVVARINSISSVVVPKVESRTDVAVVERLLDGLEAEVDRATPLAVQALVETARGVAALADVASDVRRLSGVIVGFADLAASLGRSPALGAAAWAGIRDSLVIHARAAQVAAIDGPFLGVQDDAEFAADVALATALGFDAKWVIHPRQIATVNALFTPSDEQIEHAGRVLDALAAAARDGRGAGVVDGALVDEAMARAARRILSRAGSSV